jgi:hypothetical protein
MVVHQAELQFGKIQHMEFHLGRPRCQINYKTCLVSNKKFVLLNNQLLFVHGELLSFLQK